MAYCAISELVILQIQNNKFMATQLTTDYKGQDFTASVTLGNPDLVNESGEVTTQRFVTVWSLTTRDQKPKMADPCDEVGRCQAHNVVPNCKQTSGRNNIFTHHCYL